MTTEKQPSTVARISIQRHSARRRAQRRDDPRRNYIVGIIVIVVAALSFYVALTKELPFMTKGGRLVTAYFSEPNQIQAGNTPVRVNGVNIGTVASVMPEDRGRYGKVVLRITNSDFTLHSDASAALQFRTLLGANFVVNLDPGSASAPPLGSNPIPLSRTTVQTELDDILRVFNNNTSLATRTDLSQLSSSLSGTELGSLIDATAPTLKHTAQAFSDLRGEDQNDLSTLVSSASQTVKTLADDRSDLETLVSGGSAAVGAISDQRTALASALNAAPGALDSTVDASHSIEATIPALNMLLTALQPGAKALGPDAAAARPTVVALRSTLIKLQPLLAELRPAVNELSAASGPGDAVLTALEPTLNRLNSQILPWLQSDDSVLKRPIYDLIGPTLSDLGSATAEYDSLGHTIHFPALPGINSVDLIPCTIFIADLSASTCSALDNLASSLFGGLGGSSSGSDNLTGRAKGTK